MGRLIRGSGVLSTGFLCGPCPSGTSPSPGGHSKDSGHGEYALMSAAICALQTWGALLATLLIGQVELCCLTEAKSRWKTWKTSEAVFSSHPRTVGRTAAQVGAEHARAQAAALVRYDPVFAGGRGSALYLRSRFQQKPRRTLGSSLITSWAPWKGRESKQHFNTTNYLNDFTLTGKLTGQRNHRLVWLFFNTL